MSTKKLPEFESNAARVPHRFFRPKSDDVRLSPTAIRAFCGVMLVGFVDGNMRTADRCEFARLAGLSRTQFNLGLDELLANGVVVAAAPADEDEDEDAKLPRGVLRLVVTVKFAGEYIVLPEDVVSLKSIDSTDLMVLATVFSFRNHDDAGCFPRVDEIAKQTGLPRRNVVRRLSNVRKAGLIERQQRGWDQSSQTWFSWKNPERFVSVMPSVLPKAVPVIVVPVVAPVSEVSPELMVSMDTMVLPAPAPVPVVEVVEAPVVEPEVFESEPALSVLETILPGGWNPLFGDSDDTDSGDTLESVVSVADDTATDVEIVYAKLVSCREKSGLGAIPDPQSEQTTIARLLNGTTKRRAFSVDDLCAMLSYASRETKFFLPRTGGLPSLLDTVIRDEWLPDELHRKALSAQKSGAVVGAMFKGELVADNVDWNDPKSHGWGGPL